MRRENFLRSAQMVAALTLGMPIMIANADLPLGLFVFDRTTKSFSAKITIGCELYRCGMKLHG